MESVKTCKQSSRTSFTQAHTKKNILFREPVENKVKTSREAPLQCSWTCDVGWQGLSIRCWHSCLEGVNALGDPCAHHNWYCVESVQWEKIRHHKGQMTCQTQVLKNGRKKDVLWLALKKKNSSVIWQKCPLSLCTCECVTSEWRHYLGCLPALRPFWYQIRDVTWGNWRLTLRTDCPETQQRNTHVKEHTISDLYLQRTVFCFWLAPNRPAESGYCTAVLLIWVQIRVPLTLDEHLSIEEKKQPNWTQALFHRGIKTLLLYC